MKKNLHMLLEMATGGDTPIAWPTIEKYIVANGYTVQRGKTGNTNYRLIEAKKCSKILIPPI